MVAGARWTRQTRQWAGSESPPRHRAPYGVYGCRPPSRAACGMGGWADGWVGKMDARDKVDEGVDGWMIDKTDKTDKTEKTRQTRQTDI